MCQHLHVSRVGPDLWRCDASEGTACEQTFLRTELFLEQRARDPLKELAAAVLEGRVSFYSNPTEEERGQEFWVNVRKPIPPEVDGG